MGDENKPAVIQDKWLKRADDAYEASTTFIDNNYRKQWADNLSHFHSRHASGSKYHSQSYQYRSRLFRPKTRSMVRSNEAAAAAAFFTNADAVDVEAYNRKNNDQRFSAELRDGLLNHHLTETIPWFLICCGGMQDAQTQGCVLSKQYWDLQHETTEGPNGEIYRTIQKDEPVIDLIPIENLRIDPAAKWYDPINSSPYVQLECPMYISDVKAKIASGEWLAIDDKYYSQALIKGDDVTKLARQNGKQDQSDVQYSEELSDFDQVMVLENFMRINNKEIHFYSLGTIARLTDPKPLREVYWHGIRPLSLGRVILETHSTISPGTVELSMPLQKEINEITNSRQDNIKLVLNKRYIVGRGKQVDLKSLVRNAAGSITLANDVDKDVRVLEYNDVTGSSFAEHDRLSLEYDELVGNFSGSSVQSNRKMNETVGGMAMIRGAANSMTQYLINVFAETWVQDVLRQMDMLVQEYETDIERMTEIAEERGLFQKYQVQGITPATLKERARVIVNVTNSATDPMIRLEQFLVAIQKYNEISQSAPMDMDLTEIRKEIFGRLGYKDGLRFFVDQDSDVPMVVMQLQQQIQQLSKVIEEKQIEEGAKIEMATQLANVKGELDKELENMKQAGDNLRQQREIDAERQIKTDEVISKVRTEKQVAQLKSDTDIYIARLRDNADKRKSITDDGAKAANDQTMSQIDALFKRIDEMEQAEVTGTEEKDKSVDEKIAKALATTEKATKPEKPQKVGDVNIYMPGEKGKDIKIQRENGQITGAKVTENV